IQPKGAQWTYQLRRLAKTKYGLSPKGVQQLYQSVAVRKVAYAADIWYTPIHRCAATTCITGGLCSTATDVLDAHANLWPTHHLLNLNLASLPKTHPLAPYIR
ncbi:hypothetical protein NEOLEDRAFT_1165290, partial [Neolentinus lepideus HHB14362 ss-1]